MSKKVEVKHKPDSNIFYKVGRIRVGGKKIDTPIKALELSKLRPKISIDEKFRGLNEIYKIFPQRTKLDKYGDTRIHSINDYRYDRNKMDNLTYHFESLKNKTNKDEVTICFLGFDGSTFPSDEELRFLGIESFIYSDIIPFPIITKLDDKIKASNFSEYKKFLNRVYDEYTTLNDKKLMGIIPKLAPAFIPELVNFYIDKDINSFFFDFDGSSPSTKYRDICEFFRTLHEYGMALDCFVYSLNSNIGRASRMENIIDSKDILSFGYGFDALGKHGAPKPPKEVFMRLDTSTKRLRLFNKEDYGYYRVLTTEIGNIYPKDSMIDLEDFLNIKPKKTKDGRWHIDTTIPNLFNIEQKGIETLRLRNIITNDESDNYIDSKKHIRDADKKKLKKMKSDVFKQSSISDY